MDKAIEQSVRHRAHDLCEYCLLPESVSTLKHVVDHVIARQHGGQTVVENLALCCGRCNLHKGPNVAGIDTQTGQLTALFNPRVDSWAQHFQWEGPILHGRTAAGRTTVAVLDINAPARIAVRTTLIAVGKFPPTLAPK
jgi:hypothetical protein